jgi:CheY-like chemotaxis protein
VDDLLDVARVTSAKIELRKQPVEMRGIIEDSLAGVMPLIEERGHQLDVRVSDVSVVISADPVRVKQIVDNLLSNAAKYTPSGGHIRLETNVHGSMVEVTVRDDGIGMSPDVLGRVFDLFVQADRRLDRPEGGLGVGLTVARRLAEMHNGTIGAKSDGLGKGSEFVLRLPLAAAPEPAEQPVPLFADEPRLRVLIVEDNPDAAEALALLLETFGHEIRVVADGEAALEAAKEYKPEAVLLDIGLPGIDGYEVARRMRAEPLFGGARLIAVSGYGLEQDRRRARESGFDGHLVKPLEGLARVAP